MRRLALPLIRLILGSLVAVRSATLSTLGVSITEVACDFDLSFCQFANDPNADFDWRRYTGKTPTFDTGPSQDHTTGRSYYVYLESSTPQMPNDRCRLETPLLESGSYNVSFWYSAWGSTVGILSVLVRDASSGYESLVWYYKPEVNGSKVDGSWIGVSLDGVNLMDASILVWEGIRGDGNYGDIGLDDVAVVRSGDARPAPSPQQSTEALPYMCTFESSTCGTTNYWQSTDNFTWSRGAGPGPSANTGPSVDHTFRNATGHYMMMDVGKRAQFEVAILSTPAFTSTCGCLDLTFWWHGYGSQMGSLTVTQEGFDQPLWSTADESSVNRWRQANVTFWPATNRPLQILFIGEAGPGPLGDFAIDDISVQDCTTCTITTTQILDSITTDAADDSRRFVPGTHAQVALLALASEQHQQQTASLSVATVDLTYETTDGSNPGSLDPKHTTPMDETTLDPVQPSSTTGDPPTMQPTSTVQTVAQSTVATIVVKTMLPTMTSTAMLTAVMTTMTTVPSTTTTSTTMQPTTTTTTSTTTEPTTMSTTTTTQSTSMPSTTTTPSTMVTSTTTSTTTTTMPSTTVTSTTTPTTTMPSTTVTSTTTPTTTTTTPSTTVTSTTTPTTTTTMPSTTVTSTTTLITTTTMPSTTTTLSTMPQTTTTTVPSTTTTSSITTMLLATTTTAIQSTSTTGPWGQFFCDFESDSCQFQRSGSRIGSWNLTTVTSMKPAGYPFTDHSFLDAALGTYMATLLATESSGVATLTSRQAYNPGGCNRLEFWIYAEGTDVGSLTVSLADSSTGTTSYLWITSGQNISVWTKVVTLFKAVGPFTVAFIAKGTNYPWTLFALDDIRVSTVTCSLIVSVPSVGGATTTVVNNTVYITGRYGRVQSANFPQPYPDNNAQTWIITVASDSIVGLMLTILDTEACCDLLQVFDPYAVASRNKRSAGAGLLLRASGTLNGEPQMYYSSGPTVIVTFSSDADISLTGFRLQWWAAPQTTTIPPSTAASTTQLASYGQLSCSFDVGWCGFYSDASLDYAWTSSSRSSAGSSTVGPAATDHTTGLGTYVYANSLSNASSDLARLLSPAAYSADGCSALTFYYYVAAGPALGSLTVRMLAITGGSSSSTGSSAGAPSVAAAAVPSTVLWSTSGEAAAAASGSWARAVVTFKYTGPFRLAIEVKRISRGVGTYAIDDVAVSTCAGLLDPVAPTGSTSTDSGNATLVTGSYGTIQSPNYPLDYPSSYRHMWEITVPAPQRVAVFVNDILTEACCDVLQLTDGGTGRLLRTLQGAVSSPATYYSDTNQLNVGFTTDGTVQMRGWQLTWWAAARLDTMSTSTQSSTQAWSSPTTAIGTAAATSTAAEQNTSAQQADNSTATSTSTSATTSVTGDPVTAELSGSGANANAQVGTNTSSTVPNWVYLIIAIAVVGLVTAFILGVRLWNKRNRPNKVGDSTQELRKDDQLQDGTADEARVRGSHDARVAEDDDQPSPRRRRGLHVMRDQEVQADEPAVPHRSWAHEKSWATQQKQKQHRDSTYGRQSPQWPYLAHSNELYEQLHKTNRTGDATGAVEAPPYSDRIPSETDWKQRNVVINPLHPRRQQLYLGEDGQPAVGKPTSQQQHRHHHSHRHHKRAAKKLLAPLRTAVTTAAASLGSILSSASHRSSSRVAPASPVAAESVRSIISIPGGGSRPPRPEMVVIGASRRQPDNPPVQSIT